MAAAALAVTLALAAAAPAADEVFEYDRDHPAAGLWVGTLSAGPMPVYAVVSIERSEQGWWSATATTLLLMALDKPCDELRIEDRAVTFTLRSGMGALKFRGLVSEDGQRLSGKAKPPDGADGTFEFARTMRATETAEPIALAGQIRLPNAQTLDLSLVLGETPGGNWVGQISIPAQGVRDFPLRDVARVGDAVQATLPGPPDALIEGTLAEQDTAFSGEMKQSGFAMAIELTHDGRTKMAGPSRPQHPEPPYPYEVHAFRLEHPEGHAIAGTLTVPGGPGPHPAAVLISGSGQQDRDESIFGHKPFLVIADHLTRNGIAVARYDDRGVGESTGAGTLAEVTTEGFASDAAEVVRWLRGEEGIDPERIGLIGHSEGGVIAPMVAAGDGRIAFVVLLAGTAVSGDEIMVRQNRLAFEAMGVDEERLDEMERLHRALFDQLRRGDDREALRQAIVDLSAAQLAAQGQPLPQGSQFEMAVEAELRRSESPWMRFFVTYDPAAALERLRCPVLALNGTLDLQVSHEQNLPAVERAVKRGGGDVTVKRYEGLNHLFQPAKTGLVAEYGQIETTFDAQVLEDMVKWIREKGLRD